MSATARSVNLALQEPRSVLIRQPAGATPTTVESPTLATHYHTPDIHRSAAQIIRPYARSVRKTGLEIFDDDNGTAAKAPIFSTALLAATVIRDTADNPEEAPAMSLDRARRVDLDLIAGLLG